MCVYVVCTIFGVIFTPKSEELIANVCYELCVVTTTTITTTSGKRERGGVDTSTQSKSQFVFFKMCILKITFFLCEQKL